jgi:hypothetical protein
MKSGAAIKAVLAALGITMDHPSLKAAGFNPLSLKAAGLNIAAFRAAGFDWSIVRAAGFSAAEVKAARCDPASALKAEYNPPSFKLCKAAGIDLAAFRAAGFDWSIIRAAGFSVAEVKAAGCDPASAQAAGYDVLSLVAAYGYDAVDLSSCILVSALRCTHACSILRLLPFPPFFQRDGPNLYMTLHCHKVDDHTLVEDGQKPVHVPAGWKIAPGDADDIRVCGAHPWQSDRLVFVDGDHHRTLKNVVSDKLKEVKEFAAEIGALLRLDEVDLDAIEGAVVEVTKHGIREEVAKHGIREKVTKRGTLLQDSQGSRVEFHRYDVLLRKTAQSEMPRSSLVRWFKK